MKPFFIGIAGGSGCGKSTLSYGLKKKYPGLVEVVHFDDYQKEEVDVPFYGDMRNWDHPDAINFEKAYGDLIALKQGKKVEVMTKSSVLNPTYEQEGRISHILLPKKIIILEGYMSLVNPRVLELLDLKIYLDIPIEQSMKRRDKITYNDEDEYNQKILLPMHGKYVEPTRELADLKIDVLSSNGEQVFQIVERKLKELNLLS